MKTFFESNQLLYSSMRYRRQANYNGLYFWAESNQIQLKSSEFQCASSDNLQHGVATLARYMRH